VDTATDHDVFELTGLNEVADLALGDADAGRKLLWGFEAFRHSSFGCRFRRRRPIPRQDLLLLAGEMPA
jgi:hypothetical protein